MTTSSYHVLGKDRPSPWLVTCDHASNRVPPEVGASLGLPEEEMVRHIAYDIGAAGVAKHLGELLEAPVVRSDFSRLVIDPNRGADDPTLVMKLYDGTVIPGNKDVDAAEVKRRLDLFYRPYHGAIESLRKIRDMPLLVSIHSFTRQLKGRPPRPWEIGVLFAKDRRLSDPLITHLRAADIPTGVNEPYSGHLEGDAMWQHGIETGHPHVLIEIRNDLIETPEAQRHWAIRLAPLLEQAARDANLILERTTHGLSDTP